MYLYIIQKEEQVLFTPPVADNTLAKKDFAYSPTVKFQEGRYKTVNIGMLHVHIFPFLGVKSFTDWFMKNANNKIAPNNNNHKSKSTTVNAGYVLLDFYMYVVYKSQQDGVALPLLLLKF